MVSGGYTARFCVYGSRLTEPFSTSPKPMLQMEQMCTSLGKG